MSHIALVLSWVLGYFILKFAPVRNMLQLSIFLELNFAPVLGYFFKDLLVSLDHKLSCI